MLTFLQDILLYMFHKYSIYFGFVIKCTVIYLSKLKYGTYHKMTHIILDMVAG